MRWWAAALLVVLVGCGDDAATGAGGGPSSTAGSGGAGGGTTSTQSGGGDGGSGPKAADGEPCTSPDACAGGVCLLEEATGYPGGFCATHCSPSDASTCDGSCERVEPFGSVCFASCLGGGVTCRDAYACGGAPGAAYRCRPSCTEDADCPETGACSNSHDCVAAEKDCGNLLDDDDDGLADCLDPSCAGDPLCVPGTAPLGAPCTKHSDCASPTGHPLCLSEALTGQPGGACTEGCASILGSSCTVPTMYCDYTQVFATETSKSGLIRACRLSECSASEPCRAGYTCSCESNCTPPTLPGACYADCTGDGQCTEAGHTCAPLIAGQPAVCVAPPVPEVCDNGMDDGDGDNASDCVDSECAAFCASLETQLCADAPTLAPSQSDATVIGAGIGSQCAGADGQVFPRLFRYTAPSDGTLSLALDSVLPQAVRVVDACGIQTSSGPCTADYDFDGHVELSAPVLAGASYTVLVWPAAPGHEDAFTLTSELLP